MDRTWQDIYDETKFSMTQAMYVGHGVLVRTTSYENGDAVVICFVPDVILYDDKEHSGYVVIGPKP